MKRILTFPNAVIGVTLAFVCVFVGLIAAVDRADSRKLARLVVLTERGDTVAAVLGRHCWVSTESAAIYFLDGRHVRFAFTAGLAYCIKAR